MAHSVLQQARYLMKRRKFGFAIRLLESYIANYKGSFEYYLALGTSCLYIGDEGDAAKYYQLAREIHINSSELLLGQAALLLRHGNTVKALQYYMDILDIDPNNEQAKAAMEFIRTKGKDYAYIQRIKENRKIEQFYPPIGFNPDIIRNCVFVALLLCLGIFLGIKLAPKEKPTVGNPLSRDQQRNAISQSLSSAPVHYRLEKKDVIQCYEDARMYMTQGRDNPARVEINHICNSNASTDIKFEATRLAEQLKPVPFDKLKDSSSKDKDKFNDNYSYEVVERDHVLYNGCYVAWTGTISNPKSNDDGSWQCSLLIGYQDGKHVEGIVDVYFSPENLSRINPDKPIRILGVVTEDKTGKLVLDGRTVYQPVKGKFED